MINPLQKYLDKLKVKEFSELNAEEKETYRAWNDALQGRKITDDEVKIFLDIEESETIDKLIGKKLSEREDVFLKVKLEMIRKIKVFLQFPAIEKKMVENNINSLLNK